MKDKIFLYLKGVAMGAADVVPGVSGGTIAFISGIYEELLDSIKSIDIEALQLLLKFKLKEFFIKINAGFLLVLFAGIATAVATMAKLILYLLENQPILLWSFFFGLIIASAVLVAKQVKKWSALVIVALVFGAIIAYYITTIQTVADESSSIFYIFLCGTIAICAMILPGISGSFILLLMGAYELVIGTIKNFIDSLIHFNFDDLLAQLKIIIAFMLGCLVGLLTFSRVLSWLFKHYHDIVVASLIGFLIGSLNKVWPWKQVVQELTEKHKIYGNVSPFTYGEVTGNDPLLLGAIGLAVFGFVLVYGLEKLATKDK